MLLAETIALKGRRAHIERKNAQSAHQSEIKPTLAGFTFVCYATPPAVCQSTWNRSTGHVWVTFRALLGFETLSCSMQKAGYGSFYAVHRLGWSRRTLAFQAI